jgi:cytochrome c553
MDMRLSQMTEIELINKLQGVLLHIRNSAAPSGYIMRLAEETIKDIEAWKNGRE